MTYVPVPNTMRAFMHFTQASQNVGITVHGRTPAAVVPADLVLFADALKIWHANYAANSMSSVCVLNRITVQDLTTSTGPSLDQPISPTQPGLLSGSPCPINATPVISHRTANRGRSYRGRTYLPGLAQSSQLNSTQIGTAFQAGLITLAGQLASQLLLAGITHVVVSKFTGGAPRITGLSTPVTTYIVDQAIDSQRRRLLGRGN